MRPSWSRDGNWVYFRSNRSGRQEIWKIPSKGGEAVQITRNGGYEAQESIDGKLLYFVKEGVADSKAVFYERQRNRPGGLWQMTLAGGEEKLLLAAVAHSYWAVTDHGIYFVDFSEETIATSAKPVRFFNPMMGNISQVAVIEKELVRNNPGLSVSRDGRWLAWSQIDRSESDLMLVENFR